MTLIKKVSDLNVFKISFEKSMEIFVISKNFPKDETYSLTDQIRRSSRSVCANLAEALRKRHYPKNFISKLIDCEAEAEETQIWLLFSLNCGYLSLNQYDELNRSYDQILGMLVTMRKSPEKWH